RAGAGGTEMKKFLLAGVAATALLGGSASAADLAVKARHAEPVFTWTGCYGGVNAGYAWKRTHYDVGFDPAFALAATPNRYDINPEGALAGIQAGCNYQFGQFVVGIEGDYDWGNVEDKKQLNTAAPGFPFQGFGTASEK